MYALYAYSILNMHREGGFLLLVFRIANSSVYIDAYVFALIMCEGEMLSR